MAWSVVHTTADSENEGVFHSYLMDTYLANHPQFTVTSFPSANPDERSIKITVPSALEGGADHHSYWRVHYNFGNIDPADNPTYWDWYSDYTYTSTPGDLGTANGLNYGSSFEDWSDGAAKFPAGDWLIWESSTDENAFLVTKGKTVWLYWPGPTKIYAQTDTAWQSGAESGQNNDGTCIGPHIKGIRAGVSHTGWPVVQLQGGATSGQKKAMVYDFNLYNDSGDTIRTDTGAVIGQGMQFHYSDFGSSTGNMDEWSMAAMPRTGSDSGVLTWQEGTSYRKIERSSGDQWRLMQESNSSKYFLMCDPSPETNKATVAAFEIDLGSTGLTVDHTFAATIMDMTEGGGGGGGGPTRPNDGFLYPRGDC